MLALTLYRPSVRAATAIVVLLAWVGSLGWLAMREFGQSAATALSSEATLHLAPGTIWYALYDGPVQVGNGGLTLDTLSPGYRITESLMVETPTGAGLEPATRRTETWLGATLNLERVQSQFTRGGYQTSWAISVFEDTVTARFSGALPAQGQVRLGESPAIPAALPYRLALGGDLQSGRTHQAMLLDGWPLAGRVSSVAVGGDSMLRYADSARTGDGGTGWVAAHFDSARVTAVVINTAAGPRRVWVDPEGAVAAGETALGIRWIRTDFDLSETAFRKTLRQGTPAILAALPAMQRLVTSGVVDTAVRPRRYLVSHRDGTPIDTTLLVLLGGGRQQIRGDTMVVTSVPARGDALGRGDTVADPLIQSDAGAIRALATRLVTGPLDAEDLGALIAAFRGIIAVDTTRGAAQDALGTLSRRRGGPDGVARLFVALLQAVDLPARYVVGVYPAGERLLTHAWVEVWDVHAANWLAVDPVMGQAVANTGLVRLALAGSSAPDQLLWQLANARLTELPGGTSP